MFYEQDLNIKCDQIYVGELVVKIQIALLVQEGMKDHLQKLVNDHKTVLSNNYIVSTKGTADYPHCQDAYALMRVCNFKNIPLAMNMKTADLILSDISRES
jgi:methylglyoxal synthase